MFSERDLANEIRERGWPVVFKVCEEHKSEFFDDYKQAEVGNKDNCIICHPADNDALGG
ncbi:MAG: hypothetical protein HND51_17840 [Chloroflexi bacterium]|nr:hypothetical protein [Chloroflexota bacterium]